MFTLQNSVTVVIPVYNGYEVFTELIASIILIYPETRKDISFVVVEDCSPDPRIQIYLSENYFFRRSDVKVILNNENLGFIGSVNLGIQSSSLNSDIFLLNSDTLIFSNVIYELQNVALSDGDIGSVTPLTNHGTIASLFNFPTGSTVPRIINKELLAKTVSSLNLIAPRLDMPTGIGFALYITRRMITKTGLLDPIFGKGYGEECDYCQRAIKKGFTHLLAPSCFVYHKGSESFGEAAKNSLISKNSKILSLRYPDYDFEVSKYIHIDPLSLTRLVILIEYMISIKSKIGTLHVLHNETDNFAGGTERHVLWLINNSDEQVSFVFSGTQKSDKKYCIEIFLKDYSQKEYITLEQALWFLNHYLRGISNVHIHHLMNMHSEIISLITEQASNLIYTIHDYYSICPSVNLLTGNKRDLFCEAETDVSSCENCLKKFYRSPVDITVHRRLSSAVFSSARKIIFPSETTYFYTKKVFSQIADKSLVVPHDLNQYFSLNSNISKEPCSNVIVFLGAIGKHKGADVAIGAANKLVEIHRVEIWGTIDDPDSMIDARILKRPYDNHLTLNQRFEEMRPFAVVLPSIWAETFCYTFYETIILGQTIPIVFKFGNPADQIRKFGCGVIMDDISKDSIIKASQEALINRESLLFGVQKFRKHLSLEGLSFSESYFNIKNLPLVVLSKLSKEDLQKISKVWKLRSESFYLVKSKLIKYPVCYHFLRECYHYSKKIKKVFSLKHEKL